jgi:DNA-binding response OmpR family regulator
VDVPEKPVPLQEKPETASIRVFQGFSISHVTESIRRSAVCCQTALVAHLPPADANGSTSWSDFGLIAVTKVCFHRQQSNPIPTKAQTMSDKILIIDDEETTVQLITILLERRGFDVIKAHSAEEGLRKAYRYQPDLVLLDIMMPDMDGWEVCRRLREMSDMPIIFLTARGETKDIVRGLEMGADDHIAKPYDNEELVSRIRARLRRSPKPAVSEEVVFNGGDFRINFMNREVRVHNEVKHLTPKEFSLLGVLVRNAGRVVPRQELVTEAWGDEYADAIDSLKLYIHYLRQKIERDPERPHYILTSRGVGYRFASS